MLRGGHEPGARVVRDARLRPLLECRDQRVLRQVLGQAHVSHDPCQAGDQAGRLDRADRLDRPMRVRGHGARNTISRTSHSPSHDGQCSLCSRMKARAPAIASSRDAHAITAYPPITSLASLKGPSITVSLPPALLTRKPLALAPRPPVWISEPSLSESAMSLPIASWSACGTGPWFSADFTIDMNGMLTSPPPGGPAPGTPPFPAPP